MNWRVVYTAVYTAVLVVSGGVLVCGVVRRIVRRAARGSAVACGGVRGEGCHPPCVTKQPAGACRLTVVKGLRPDRLFAVAYLLFMIYVL